MSVQWWLCTALALMVCILACSHAVYHLRRALTARAVLRQDRTAPVERLRVRGGRASAMLTVDDEHGRCYRVVTKMRGQPLTVTYCPPSKRLLRLHVERLAERNPS